MVEFREHYVGSERVIDVFIIQNTIPPIKAGELRRVLKGGFWLETTPVCYELDELLEIVYKLRELNDA